jgi:hypothetical protein
MCAGGQGVCCVSNEWPCTTRRSLGLLSVARQRLLLLPLHYRHHIYEFIVLQLLPNCVRVALRANTFICSSPREQDGPGVIPK